MATEFVHFLQHNSPQLHYGSLTPAFMSSKVSSPYDRTFLSTNRHLVTGDKEMDERSKERKAARAKLKVWSTSAALWHRRPLYSI